MGKRIPLRRPRADSTESQTAAFHRALKGLPELPPGMRLRKMDLDYIRQILEARKHSEWNVTDIYHAANLARCFADIERLSGKLEQEGETSYTERGTPVINPIHQVLETLSRRAIQLTRLLQLDPLSRYGDRNRKDAAKRIAKEEVMHEAADVAAEDSLIALPSRGTTTLQ